MATNESLILYGIKFCDRIARGANLFADFLLLATY